MGRVFANGAAKFISSCPVKIFAYRGIGVRAKDLPGTNGEAAGRRDGDVGTADGGVPG